MTNSIKNLLHTLSVTDKVTLFNTLCSELSSYGRGGDTELAHINAKEAALLKQHGGSGSINPITSLREYKGGGGSAPQQPTTSRVSQENSIPDEIKPYMTDILAEAQSQYRSEKEQGYTPYTGPQLAAFTPEQLKAFEGTRQNYDKGLNTTEYGSSLTYIPKALDATMQAAAPTTSAEIRSYMDPYLENVLQVQEREARRANDISGQERAATAVNAGAFGGSREAVQEAEAQRNLEDRLASMRATGMSASFANAQQAAEQQRQRYMDAGKQYAGLGDTAAQQQAREIGGLAASGEALRGQQQSALDLAKQQFTEEKQFPQVGLQQYSSIIRGFPVSPNQLATTQSTTPQPSLTQQLLGAGVGAAGLAGAFGAFKKEGGLVGLASGGRPMNAAPKSNDRTALMGSAIGELAKKMAPNRPSIMEGGIRSLPSAILTGTLSNISKDTSRSNTAVQMQPETGGVANYSAGTGQGTVDGPYSFSKNLDETAIMDANYFNEQDREQQVLNAKREALSKQQVEQAKTLTKEKQAYLDVLKRRSDELTGRRKEVDEDAGKDRDVLDRQKYLSLLNIGAAIAAPSGQSRGMLPDITNALAGQSDKFGSIMEKEANVNRDRRKALDSLSDSEISLMAATNAISKADQEDIIAAEKAVLDNEARNQEQKSNRNNAAMERGTALRNEALKREELEVARAAAQAEKEAAKNKDSASAYNALREALSFQYTFGYDPDTKKPYFKGQILERNDPIFFQFEKDFNEVWAAFKEGGYKAAQEKIKSLADTKPPEAEPEPTKPLKPTENTETPPPLPRLPPGFRLLNQSK